MRQQREKLEDAQERKQFRKSHKGMTIADMEIGR